MQVTARELKLRLGQCLAAVRAGETVRITLRGRPIAEIHPLAPTSDDRLAQLVGEGLARPGKGKLEPLSPVAAARSASAIVGADREDKTP